MRIAPATTESTELPPCNGSGGVRRPTSRAARPRRMRFPAVAYLVEPSLSEAKAPSAPAAGGGFLVLPTPLGRAQNGGDLGKTLKLCGARRYDGFSPIRSETRTLTNRKIDPAGQKCLTSPFGTVTYGGYCAGTRAAAIGH